jgi:hypothetical protein
MRAASFGWLLLPLGLGLACGGKFSQGGDGDGDGDGATSSGGTQASGGTSQGQGAVGARAGAASKGGAPAQAGQPAMGGACFCAPVACPPGTEPVPDASGCCYTCEKTGCPDLPCRVPPSCPPGYHLETPAGACCPECTRDGCEKARDEYLQYSRRVIEKYNTLPCTLSQDCGLYYEKNACNLSCGTPMPWDAYSSLNQDLQAYAKICDGCPFSDVPPCAPTPEPQCINGRCQLPYAAQ